MQKLRSNVVNYDDGKHERKIGRYWASDIYSIAKGYLRVGNFFDRSKINEEGCLNIDMGMALEENLERILTHPANKTPHKYNPKYVLDIFEGATITVKPDFEFKTSVLETKAPKVITKEIPEKWMYQLEAEHRATGKEVWLGVFRNDPLRRDTMPDCYLYTPSDERWNYSLKVLSTFHDKLIKKYGKTK